MEESDLARSADSFTKRKSVVSPGSAGLLSVFINSSIREYEDLTQLACILPKQTLKLTLF